MMKGSESLNMKKFGQCLAKSLLFILLSAALGTGLLILSELLPAGPMDRHLADSAGIFRDTGKYPSLYTWCSSRLDNDSDAKLLQMAASVSAEKPVEAAMMTPRGMIGEKDPVQVVVSHYLEGEPYDRTEPYTRYWHGYAVILRVLLLFMNYRQIRQVNLVLQVGLVLAMCAVLWAGGKKTRGMIPPLLISYAMLMPPVIGRNIEYSVGFYTSMLFSLILLLLHRKGKAKEKEYLVLLFSGIFTCYWDVLTYPMAPLGFPMTVAFFLNTEDKISGALRRGIRMGFFWTLGYGLMWLGKWSIGSLLTGRNFFEDGFGTIMERTSGVAAGESLTAAGTIGLNLRYFFRTPVSFVFLAYLLVMLALLGAALIRSRGQRTGSMKKAENPAASLLPFLALAFLSPVWYAVTKNHASIHPFLASKSLIVTTMALMCGLRLAWQIRKGSERRA